MLQTSQFYIFKTAEVKSKMLLQKEAVVWKLEIRIYSERWREIPDEHSEDRRGL